MPEQSVITFGYTIAYVLPGGAALLVAGLSDPRVTAWLAELSTKDVSVGGFLFFMGAATAAGMILQALRWALFELLLGKRFVSFPELDEAKRTQPGVADALADIRENHYRHYQSYGAFFIALAPLPLLTPLSWGGWLLFLAAEVVLLLATRDCLKRLRDKTAAILRFESPLRAA